MYFSYTISYGCESEVGERGFLVSPGYEVSSGLNPMSSYISPDVNALKLDQRGKIVSIKFKVFFLKFLT